MRNKNVLVTGGAGFIGSHLTEALAEKNFVRVVDVARGDESVCADAEFIKASVTDARALRRACKDVDYVIHLAAVASVPLSFKKPLLTMETNVLGTINVLEAARQSRVKRVVFISSASVYGDSAGKVNTEKTTLEPRSPYAVSKLCGENLCRLYAERGLSCVSLRLFNVFGPRQGSGVVAEFLRAAKNGENLKVTDDGKQTRDFIFVYDVVDACLSAAERGEGVYNIGSGKPTSVLELARKIISLTQSKSKIIFEPERAGDGKHSCADITLARKELGFKPRYSLEDGLRLMIQPSSGLSTK